MDYTFAPLYVRIIFYALLGIACAFIFYVFTKNQKKIVNILVPAIIITIFAMACSSFIYHLINPQIKTLTCTYVREEGRGLNPLTKEHIFLHNGEKMWIELDSLTRKMVVENNIELKEGSTYTVIYEEKENLILGIKEK